jgi:hypothetical protein
MADSISLGPVSQETGGIGGPPKSLVDVLGFGYGSAPPWIEYIRRHSPDPAKEDQFLHLCACVVLYCKDKSDTRNIQQLLDDLIRDENHFYFTPERTGASSDERQIAVQSTVMLVLGLCTLMRTYFLDPYGQQIYIETISQHHGTQEPFRQSLTALITNSALLPNPAEGLPRIAKASGATAHQEAGDAMTFDFGFHPNGLEGFISKLDMNIFKMMTVAGVQIRWTDNLSRHMLLSNQGPRKRYIELFALPGAFSSGPDTVLDKMGISFDLQEEICFSYATLFNPTRSSKLHCYVGKFAWCWCMSCSSARLTRQELTRLRKQCGDGTVSGVHWKGSMWLIYDPELEKLTKEECQEWRRETYTNLWPRIVALDKCVQEAKPWNFWVLLRDRRDTVQYWTFLFGSIILVLTVLQVFLGTLQVASPFSN